MFEWKYQSMDKAHSQLMDNIMLATYEYLLTVGDGELLEEIDRAGKDISVFPHVAERLKEWKENHV